MDMPGFRFYPTEEELVSFYLRNKLEARREDLLRVMDRLIPVLDIYGFNPWELPQFSGDLCHGDPEECFFFIPRQESKAHGGRPKRLTATGYWKATGSPGFVYSSKSNRCIGEKRTMVFYNGRAPNGQKTDWKMNEYKAIKEEEASSSSGAYPKLREEFSLCRVYKKSNFVRAFDRRPLGVENMVQMRAQAAPDDGATAFHQSPSAGGITCSHDSSTSGHHGQPFQTGEISDMAIVNEPIWEWEQLDQYWSKQGHSDQQ
ncbi:NAC domain-containing protein 90-like [Populus nigra]|uniref:NAC domain-containing protein 90-like n=1 Tax=Populus nigra TaxID=3691 RepID=UPI002B26D7E4|nr:NAC domain-containing protein 90-like [Populus nigra]